MSQKTIKITILKKLDRNELFGDNPPISSMEEPVCPIYDEEQIFYSRNGKMPEGFCTWAWNNIYLQANHLMLNGNYPWLNDRGKAVACCTDGLRPVIFLLERIEDLK